MVISTLEQAIMPFGHLIKLERKKYNIKKISDYLIHHGSIIFMSKIDTAYSLNATCPANSTAIYTSSKSSCMYDKFRLCFLVKSLELSFVGSSILS